MKKVTHFFGILTLVIVGLLSCGKTKDKATDKIVIAVIPKIDNEIFAQVKQSALQTAQNLGITVTWEAPTGIDGAKQKELIENLIQYGVDGILISCNDAELLREPINKAVEAGIKVGTFDSDCPDSKRICYVGTDNHKAGKICAETLLKLSENATKKDGKILILSSSSNAPNMRERIKGFTSVIDQSRISNVLYSYEMTDYGKELLSYNLKNSKNITAVQMLWGTPALNGIDSIPVLREFIKKGGVTIFFDVSKPLLRFISKTENCATMKQDFEAMGREGITNLYNAIKGNNFEKQILYNVLVIDKNNAAQELENIRN